MVKVDCLAARQADLLDRVAIDVAGNPLELALAQTLAEVPFIETRSGFITPQEAACIIDCAIPGCNRQLPTTPSSASRCAT